MTESMGCSCLLTDNCICDDNLGDDSMEGGDCSCDYYNTLKDVLGQQINRKQGETETWNWMTDWNVRKKPRMCGNLEVAAISLDHEA